MKFSIQDFFINDQIRRKLRIWSHLLTKSLIENFIFLCSYRIQYLQIKPSEEGTNTTENMMLCMDLSDEQKVFDAL